MKKIAFLSGNMMKLLAAVLMTVDHVGLMLFPKDIMFRIIGRLSFPIFAFMISEGAKYTKDKLRYFLTMASFALVFQVVFYYFSGGSTEMCIFVTFSLSLPIIFSLQFFKQALFINDKKEAIMWLWLCGLMTVLTYLLTKVVSVDYGFLGIMCPVFANILNTKDTQAPAVIKKLDVLPLRVLTFALCLFVLSAKYEGIQYYSLLALPILLLYSEKKGKFNMKYFFYLFYPIHLVIIEGIYLLTR